MFTSLWTQSEIEILKKYSDENNWLSNKELSILYLPMRTIHSIEMKRKQLKIFSDFNRKQWGSEDKVIIEILFNLKREIRILRNENKKLKNMLIYNEELSKKSLLGLYVKEIESKKLNPIIQGI